MKRVFLCLVLLLTLSLNVTAQSCDWNELIGKKLVLYRYGRMDYNGAAALAEMAYLYPEFIKSIIHQESPEIFCVDMFDPMGKPIKVRVTNRFMLNREGGHVFNVGKDGEPNWVAILEKAVMKWISAYQHLTGLAFCNSEWIVPMFTGDGRSFCIRPGQLSLKDLARVVNTCLDYGLIVEGIEWIKKENSEEVAGKLYGNSVLPPQKAGALFSMRNNAVSDDVADLRNIMPDEEKDPPLIGLRINSPGVAAKFFKKADSRK